MTAIVSERDRALTVYQEEPFNAGAPLAALRRSVITPQPLFYARNHAPLPTVDPAAFRLAAGPVRVQGYALAGGDRDVARVDVPADGGQTWVAATLRPAGSRWTWRFWEGVLTLPAGPGELVVRAYDTAANTQPENPAPLWNVGGYMNNAWHRVQVQVT